TYGDQQRQELWFQRLGYGRQIRAYVRQRRRLRLHLYRASVHDRRRARTQAIAAVSLRAGNSPRACLECGLQCRVAGRRTRTDRPLRSTSASAADRLLLADSCRPRYTGNTCRRRWLRVTNNNGLRFLVSLELKQWLGGPANEPVCTRCGWPSYIP